MQCNTVCKYRVTLLCISGLAMEGKREAIVTWALRRLAPIACRASCMKYICLWTSCGNHINHPEARGVVVHDLSARNRTTKHYRTKALYTPFRSVEWAQPPKRNDKKMTISQTSLNKNKSHIKYEELRKHDLSRTNKDPTHRDHPTRYGAYYGVLIKLLDIFDTLMSTGALTLLGLGQSLRLTLTYYLLGNPI